MKTYTIILGWIFLTLTISCKETQLTNPNPNPKEEINIEDYLYDYNFERQQCSQRLGYPFDIQPFGLSIESISKNKTFAFVRLHRNNVYLLRMSNSETNLEPLNFTSLTRQDTTVESVKYVHFSPYDNNKAIILLTSKIRSGSVWVYIDEWCYYNIESNKFELLNLQDSKFENFRNNKLIRWVNTSTQGADNFFLQNNTIISYPSGNILPNPTNFVLRSEEKVHSISPDMKKIFTNLNGDLYLNGTKVEKSQYQFWDFLPINWSDDSQYFLGVGLEANPGAQLNIVYKMENGANNKFKIYRIADMMRKYCTKQHPTGFWFDSYSNSIFLNDSTFAMTLFPNLSDNGDIFEVNFKGDTLRNITKKYQ
jgi:hypothetical protein